MSLPPSSMPGPEVIPYREAPSLTSKTQTLGARVIRSITGKAKGGVDACGDPGPFPRSFDAPGLDDG